MRIEKGTMLLLSQGSYSDYQIHGLWVVSRAFDPVAVLTEFHENTEPTGRIKHVVAGNRYWTRGAFVRWLEAEKYLDPVGCSELNIGPGALGIGMSYKDDPSDEACEVELEESA